MKNLTGSIVALVTPFLEDGRLDAESLKKLVHFHLEMGTDAILVNGTTGESPTISREEFDQLTKLVVEEVKGKIPVLAGTGCNSTDQAIFRSQIAEENGVDGLLVVSPYYSKPTRKGIKSYFEAIADSCELPIVIYNVPGRTSSCMEIDLILELARENNQIQAIKEATGNMERIMSLIQLRPEGFKVYSGDDSLALSTVLMGGDGCISVVANQIPKIFSQMMRSALDGDIDIARNLHYKYYRLMQLNFIETNPIPVKTALFYMGKVQKNFRSPMCAMETNTEKRLVEELNKLGLIVEEKAREILNYNSL